MDSRVACLALLFVAACSSSDSVVSTGPRTASAIGSCLSFTPRTPISVPPNSGPWISLFTAKATNCGATSLWSVSASRSGSVTAITSIQNGTFSLGSNGTISTKVWFTAGAAGVGRVIAHAQVDGVPGDFVDTVIVNVTSSAAGLQFGLSGLSPSEFPTNAIWTGGLRSIEPVNQILSELNIAQNHSPRIRMWFYFTGGDEQRFKDGTGAFNLQAWKDTLDYYATAAHTKPFNTDGSSQFAAQLQPYMQGGALMGILLLDDIGNFTPAVSHAQIEGMAAQAKLRYPGITTAVRQRPSKLGTGTYSSLDAAWAQ